MILSWTDSLIVYRTYQFQKGTAQENILSLTYSLTTDATISYVRFRCLQVKLRHVCLSVRPSDCMEQLGPIGRIFMKLDI